tara:strand:- start:691 stop:1158 length:468 start_codon:yes stop_codon:yes gene_type:complete
MDDLELEEEAPTVIERKPHAARGRPASEAQLANLAKGRAARAQMKEDRMVRESLEKKAKAPEPVKAPEPIEEKPHQLIKPRARKPKAEPEPEPEPIIQKKPKKKKQVIIVEASSSESSEDEGPQIVIKRKSSKPRPASPPEPIYVEPPAPKLRRA